MLCIAPGVVGIERDGAMPSNSRAHQGASGSSRTFTDPNDQANLVHDARGLASRESRHERHGDAPPYSEAAQVRAEDALQPCPAP
jgi:hypothetical protein